MKKGQLVDLVTIFGAGINPTRPFIPRPVKPAGWEFPPKGE